MAGRKESRGRRGATNRGVPRARAEKKAKVASTLETARRVDVIVGLMQRDEWRPERGALLADEWKVSPITVEHIAAEASRRVVFIAQLANDPSALKTDVTKVLMRSLHAAHDERARSDVARIGDVVTKIVGAQAPQRVDMNVRQYEELPPSVVLAKLREQRAKLDEAIARLEAESPEPITPALPAGPEGVTAEERDT